MKLFLLVCAGGAIGSGLRYLVSIATLRAFGPVFPWGTLFVNVTGSFLIALLFELGGTDDLLPPEWRAAVGTGLLGGFTTYSTFNWELIALLRNDAWGLALLNGFLTVSLCLLAGAAGYMSGRLLRA